MILNKFVRIIKGKEEIKACDNPLMIAHRGGANYNTFEYRNKKPEEFSILENSKSAFKRAVESGVKAFETDIHLTKDNELIVIHDKTLDRTTNASGYISEYTMEDLNNVYTNNELQETLPTLKWIFDEFGKDITYIIEIKGSKDRMIESILVKKLADLLNSYGLNNNCSIISFFPNPLKLIKWLIPDISTGLLVYTKNFFSNFALNFAFTFGVDTISFNYNGLNEKLVNLCRKSGFKIGAWTVNTKEDMNYMKKLKIDYITSDFLDLVLS